METFVMRVWTPMDGDGAESIRGVATHVRSGRQQAFVGAAALFAFVRDSTGEVDLSPFLKEPDRSGGGPEEHG